MLQWLVGKLLYSLLRLDPANIWAQSLDYFIYDSIKIMLLLFVMIAFIGFLRSYIPQEKMKKWLSLKAYGLENVAASVFGAITPFCSCSSIPIFLTLIRAGVPLGVMMSFLVTSPIINEYLVVLMLGFFGWKITLAYVLAGLVIGIAVGRIMGFMGLEKYIIPDMKCKLQKKAIKFPSFKSRLQFGASESFGILKRLYIWIFVGVGAGALIHNFVPQEAIQAVLQRTGIFTVPLGVLIGVPLYGSCAAIVPIAVALFQKGIPIGTALAFMMAVSALSLPEAVILRGVMKTRLIAIFFSIVALGIIIIGYLLNFLQGILL